MDAYEPFRDVTRRALGYAPEAYGLGTDEATRERILAAYDDLDPYLDAVATPERLSDAGTTVAVLSNGTPAMLERLTDAAGLAPHLDTVCSADAVGVFNPAAAVYETAAATVWYPVDDCRLVSGNAWDVAGAGAAGMATAWVNRDRDSPEAVGPAPGGRRRLPRRRGRRDARVTPA
jgi:2-haloacid dehalogenase